LHRSVYWQQLIKGEIEIAPMGTSAADAGYQVGYSAAARVLVYEIGSRTLEQTK
jgi:hypothetical protein